jgi:hypothetical protein
MESPLIVLLTEPEKWQAAGVHYPKTTEQARWLYRHRHQNGFADAFREVQGRICLDVSRFVELVRQRPAA